MSYPTAPYLPLPSLALALPCLPQALLIEEEAEVEAEFCENLYRLRRNEQYRENFVHEQMNKVTHSLTHCTVPFGCAPRGERGQ